MFDCTASGTKRPAPSSIPNAGRRSAAGAVWGAVLSFAFSCIGAALRRELARIDCVVGQEFVQEIADTGDAAAVGPARARDELVEGTLEAVELVDATDRDLGIGGVEGVGRDLMALGVVPVTLEILRAAVRPAFAIAPDTVHILAEEHRELAQIILELAVEVGLEEQPGVQGRVLLGVGIDHGVLQILP